ncbi:MAG: hypothetical protein DMG58_19030, partial [Acidobacteria bacterium]
APWSAALRSLLSDRELYLRESAAARDAATKFVSALRPGQLEEFLLALAPGRPDMRSPLTRSQDALERLSPEKRTLLLQRLRARDAR